MTPEPQNLQTPPLPPPPVPPTPFAPPTGRERLIRRVRQRQRTEFFRQGLLHGLTAGLILSTASGFAALLWAPLGRVMLCASPLLAAAIALGFAWWRTRKEVGDDPRTARLIGRRVPGMSYDLLGAVELATRSDHGASAELVEAFLLGMELRTASVDPKRVVDLRGSKRAGRWTLATGLLGCLLISVGFASWKTGLQQAFSRKTASSSTTVREPITGDIELTYQYPAYMGLAPKTVTASGGEISGPAGTRVLLKTRADREVGRAQAVVNGTPVPLRVEGGRTLIGDWVLEKSGSYLFRFQDAQGKALAEGPPVPISVQADQPPKVTILTPGDELEVDPRQQVTLKFDASDDYGLTDLSLVYKVTGQKEETRVALPKDEGRSYRGVHRWDLGALKLRPGDRVSYFVEARDNDDISGRKKGTSRTLSLRVYSSVEHRRRAQEKTEALWERLVSHLANRMEGPDRKSSGTLEQVRGQAPVDDQGLSLVREMAESAIELSRDKDAPRELWTALVTISDALSPKIHTTAASRNSLLRNAQRPPGEMDFGQRLTRAVEQEMAEAERDVLYLEALLDRQKLEDLKEMAKELSFERRELTKLVEDYKRAADPHVKEQVLEQIARMRGRIEQLLQKMSTLSKGIRDEHFNEEAVKKLLEDKDLSGGMDQVEKLLREGQVDEALKRLQKMSLQLEEMIQGMDNSENQVGQVDPQLAQRFSKFIDKLEDTKRQQAALAQQTQALRDRYRSQLKERLQRKGQELRKKLLEDAERVAKDLSSLDPHALQSRAERPLEAAQSELGALQDALKASDFDLAAEAAARAEEMGRELSMLGEQQLMMDEVFHNPPEARAQTKKTSEQLKEDHRTLKDISQRLQQLFPNPSSMMSEQDQKKLRELSEAQRKLREQTQSLQGQMKELSEQAPLFDQEAESQMQQVTERMGQAADKLQARDPARGHADQKAALEQLQKFEQALQEGGSGGKRGGLPLPMMAGGQGGFGPANPHEKVELPDENQFQAPQELRKDLLDAMKQGAPDRYREQVKRYYEELVK